MKRFLSAGIIFLSICFIMVSASKSMARKRFSDYIVPEADYSNLTNHRASAEHGLLSEIYFNNFPLCYDEKKDSWFYSVDKNAPVLDPVIRFKSPEKGAELRFKEAITPGKTISFLIYTDKFYKEYSLVITTLPLIKIESQTEDYLTGIDLEKIYPIRFTLYDNRSESFYPIITSEGTLHMRGEISRFFDKKNFRLKLSRKEAGKEIHENNIPLLGLRQDGDWILYSAYNDQEKIRNVFSTNLWMESCAEDNSFGLLNGSEYRYVELFWNQQYCGLYALGYPIDAKQMMVQPDVTGHYDEFVFKQKHWGPKTDGPDPNYDGLILQYEASQSDVNNGIALTKMYFAMLENGASNGLWSNDEKNVLDIWLFIKLIQGADQVNEQFPGKLRNMFITIKTSNTGRKFLYTPWDMDISWGNITNTFDPRVINYTNPYILDPDDNSYEMTVNPVSILRKSDPGIVNELKNRYHELRSDAWSDETIDRMLDGYEQDIYGSGAYVRDMERWPDGSYQDPNLGLSVFRDYVHKRLRSMDQYIEELKTVE